jgi:hypothetical protein
MFGLFTRNRKASEKATAQPAQQVTPSLDPLTALTIIKGWHEQRAPIQKTRYEQLYILWQSGKVGNDAVISAYSQWMSQVMMIAKLDSQIKAQSSQPVQQSLF